MDLPVHIVRLPEYDSYLRYLVSKSAMPIAVIGVSKEQQDAALFVCIPQNFTDDEFRKVCFHLIKELG